MEERRGRHDGSSISPLRAGVIWAAGAVAATWSTPVSAIAVAALTGILLAVCARGPMAQRAGLLAVAAPIAVLHGTATWPWLVAFAGMLVAALATPAVSPASTSAEALERGLAWYRRRGEPADVLVVRPADPGHPDARSLSRLSGAFRAADAVALWPRGDDVEIHALLDATGLDRRAVERRLRTGAATPVTCHWASFPRDGATVAALLDHALADGTPVPLPEPVPYPALTLGDAS